MVVRTRSTLQGLAIARRLADSSPSAGLAGSLFLLPLDRHPADQVNLIRQIRASGHPSRVNLAPGCVPQ